MTTVKQRGYITDIINNYLWEDKGSQDKDGNPIPRSFNEIHSKVVEETYDNRDDFEDFALPSETDTYIALEIMKLAKFCSGNFGEGYKANNDGFEISYYVLEDEDLYKLEEAMEGYVLDPKGCSIRTWLLAKAPKTMAKLEKRTATYEKKLAKYNRGILEERAREKRLWERAAD